MAKNLSRGESELEKFIVDFVYEKVTERVRLHLSDVITVRPTRVKGGAILLATLWCNVLQHKANFPPAEFSYVAHKVANGTGKLQEILELNVEKDGIQFFVDMCTGSLTISGQYVYDWFTAKFEQCIDNFDQVFAKNWTFAATPAGDLPLRTSGNRQREEKDLIEVAVQHRHTDVKLAAIYTSVRCDPYRQSSESSCGAIQRSVLKRYDAAQQTYAEQLVLQRIAYPVRVSLGTAFTAIVTAGGQAEVLLTGANYHNRDLAVGKMASVTFVRTTHELFTERYLKPLEVPAVTPVELE